MLGCKFSIIFLISFYFFSDSFINILNIEPKPIQLVSDFFIQTSQNNSSHYKNDLLTIKPNEVKQTPNTIQKKYYILKKIYTDFKETFKDVFILLLGLIVGYFLNFFLNKRKRKKIERHYNDYKDQYKSNSVLHYIKRDRNNGRISDIKTSEYENKNFPDAKEKAIKHLNILIKDFDRV